MSSSSRNGGEERGGRGKRGELAGGVDFASGAVRLTGGDRDSGTACQRQRVGTVGGASPRVGGRRGAERRAVYAAGDGRRGTCGGEAACLSLAVCRCFVKIICDEILLI